MNWRKHTYLSYASLRGYRFPTLFARYRREYERGVSGNTTTKGLAELLRHCRAAVPYYASVMAEAGELDGVDPREYLRRLPVLTKSTIRENFDKLQSTDLHRRKWSYNTSGGSTGEPIRLIQDLEYEDQSKAITMVFYSLMGHEIGQPVVWLWGDDRDVQGGTHSPKARFFNWLTNTTWLSAYLLSPERMRQYVHTLNRVRPSLIVAYAQSAYELAQFIERDGLTLEPQRALVATAGTLYPFMREKIAKVFRCKVYNQYGSREISDLAFEIPDSHGLRVPPWSGYVEILDDDGMPVSAGEEGNIVVTCLTNYAMPLIRYSIGDRGALMPDQARGGSDIQVLKQVSGRNMDVFRRSDDGMVDSQYFIHLLYFRPWVWKFQVVQKSHEQLLFKVVGPQPRPPSSELEDIAAKARMAMGPDCRVDFEFLSELPPHPSGKYRYTISEVAA